eukprot:TRINITY_DN18082_c0_g2_i1.p1 TRINITY_DN18082_c0_g2~~TRINITY_DN18082_c0_g2_i1.p1  ORF type:complete len:626 (+),score=280.48 TRINITY_DN18082_c0_g2_i1:62-1879(+)
MGHEDDYGVPLDEDMEEEVVSVPSSAELYPNPCGGWADVGPFRDVWWVLVWVLSLGLLGFFGVHNYTTGNYYIGSSGSVDLTFKPLNSTRTVQYTANTDGECSHLPQTTHSIAVRCDDKFLYIGGMQHTYEDEAMINIKRHEKDRKAATFYSECTQEDGAPGRLKRDPLTKAIPLSQLIENEEEYFQLPKGLPYATVKVAANRCTVDDSTTSSRTMRLLGLACFLSIVVGVAQLFLMRAFPRETIIGGFIMMAIVCAGLAAFAGVSGDVLGAIVFGLCAVIWPIFLCLMWSHLALAALCLKMSSNVVLTYWGTMVTSTGVLLLQFVLVFTFVFAAGNDNGEANAVSVLCLFILFWGQEVLLNTVHVTTAGVTSHWFFALGGPGTPPYFRGAQAATGVTLGALKRAAVWSLGSICFGSLFVAILRTVRFLIRVAMRRGNALVRCIVLCLLNYIEQLMRYFNDFAFVQVAMFGKPYITAAKDTWALVKNGTGWEALINQVMVNRIFAAFSLQGGLIVGLVTYLASDRQLVWFLAGGLTGLLLVSMLMKLAYSGVMTVFLGFWHLKSCGVTWSPVELNGYKVEPEVSDAMATQYATVGTVDENEGRVN